eukprot:2576105-Pleurochrysis_carterae.AAC.1
MQTMRDLEPQRTVDMEILAQVFNHMTLARASQQEPIITLCGLSENGIRRFFAEWPRVQATGATMWK